MGDYWYDGDCGYRHEIRAGAYVDSDRPAGTPDCEAELETPDGHEWVCTRQTGHPGRHVACGVNVVAAWPGTHEPTADDLTDGDLTDERPQLSLVMPFVTVTSKGGPHDDDSYTAGWECGRLDGWLSVVSGFNGGGMGDWRPAGTLTCRTVNVPQIDLIAMRHGYLTERLTEDVDGWTQVRLTPDLNGGERHD